MKSVVILVALVLQLANALHFYLNTNDVRCFYENLQAESLVVGKIDAYEFNDYTKEYTKNPNLKVQITVEVCQFASDGIILTSRKHLTTTTGLHRKSRPPMVTSHSHRSTLVNTSFVSVLSTPTALRVRPTVSSLTLLPGPPTTTSTPSPPKKLML